MTVDLPDRLNLRWVFLITTPIIIMESFADENTTNRPDDALVATDRHTEGAIDRQLDQQTNTSMMTTG
uniref:Secreted protein n=1 Tax=Haemonchus contortus TaxID=6289 RepID=A0A7I4Z7X4_HAECO